MIFPDSNYDFALDQTDEAREALASSLTPYEEAIEPLSIEGALQRQDKRLTLEHDNQTKQGSCAAVGGTSGLESIVHDLLGRVIPLSRQWLYIRAQDRSGIKTDSGCSIGQCIWLMKNVGVPCEKYQPYPYQGYTRNIRREADEQAQHCKLVYASPLETYEQCVEWLRMNNTAVYVAMAWRGNMSKPGPRLTTYRPQWSRGRGPGHALVIPQIRPEMWGEHEPDLDLKNSHFLTWGTKGSTWLSPDFVREVLDHPSCRQFGGFIGMRGVKVTGPDFLPKGYTPGGMI